LSPVAFVRVVRLRRHARQYLGEVIVADVTRNFRFPPVPGIIPWIRAGRLRRTATRVKIPDDRC